MVRATNRIGLERAGFNKDNIEQIYRAIRILTQGTSTVEAAVERIIKECQMSDDLQFMLDFISKSGRGLGL